MQAGGETTTGLTHDPVRICGCNGVFAECCQTRHQVGASYLDAYKARESDERRIHHRLAVHRYLDPDLASHGEAPTRHAVYPVLAHPTACTLQSSLVWHLVVRSAGLDGVTPFLVPFPPALSDDVHQPLRYVL